jgi:VanZ family protein
VSRLRPFLGAADHGFLALGYLVFVIVGSLAPFHYRPLPLEEGLRLFRGVCQRGVHIESWSDLVTNILLLIPLAYLLMAAAYVDRPWGRGLLAAALVIPSCAALSLAIEFTQLWFPPRVSALDDVAAGTGGAALGTLAWLTLGLRLTHRLRRAGTAVGLDRGTARWLPVYLILLVAVHAWPLDLTIRLSELRNKVRGGAVHLVPFGGWAERSWQSAGHYAWQMVLFLPCGWLLSGLAGARWRSRRGWPGVVFAGLVLAGLMEVEQFFVFSRDCDAGEVLTGTLAVLIGWAMSLKWAAARNAVTAEGPGE